MTAPRDRQPWRVVLADDHALLLEAMALLLAPVAEVVGTATDGAGLLEQVEALRPDLVITDLSMPGMSGFDVLRALRRRSGAMQSPEPSIGAITTPPVLVVTVHADIGTLRAALAAGAAGYLVKSAASTELLRAVEVILAGGRYVPSALQSGLASAPVTDLERLSPRQRAVLEALARGQSAKQIAALLGISERTVAFHKEQLRKRLGVQTPVEMVALLQRAGAWTAGAEPDRG